MKPTVISIGGTPGALRYGFISVISNARSPATVLSRNLPCQLFSQSASCFSIVPSIAEAMTVIDPGRGCPGAGTFHTAIVAGLVGHSLFHGAPGGAKAIPQVGYCLSASAGRAIRAH